VSSAVGAHLVEPEAPDAFFIRLVGDLDETQVMAILDHFEQFATGPGPAYQLIDVSRVGHITKEARRVAGIRPLPPAYAGLVVFGGTFQQQLVAKLATMAGWFLRGRALGKPMPVTTKDESGARAWLEQQRRGR
jgi:hypothetical protein